MIYPLEAIFIAKRAGADQITIHLREDRRHIHDSDLYRIAESSFLPLNVECCSETEMLLHFTSKVKPHRVTLVPEKRDEVTTEGGLRLSQTLLKSLKILRDNEIQIALFIDPNIESIEKSAEFAETLKVPIAVELHTGKYANISLMLNSNLSRTHNSIQDLNLDRKALQKTRANTRVAKSKRNNTTRFACKPKGICWTWAKLCECERYCKYTGHRRAKYRAKHYSAFNLCGIRTSDKKI